MGKKKKTRRSGRTSRSGRTNRKITGRWSGIAPLILILVVILCSGYFIIFLTADNKLSFDLRNVETAKQWQIIQGEVNQQAHSQKGLRIEMKQGYGILANSASAVSEQNKKLFSQQWQDTPYIKISVSPEEYDREMQIIWLVQKKPLPRSPFVIPALSESVIVDTRASYPWYRIFPFAQHEQIQRIGLVFPQQIEINKIEFLSVLRPDDLLKTIFQQLTTVQPIVVGSINYYYGMTVLGHSYTTVLGIIILLLGLLMVVALDRKVISVFIVVSAICFILLDLSYFQTLWHHAKDSYKISSLYDDRYEEFLSRFGKEFASLDKLLKEHIPEQSKVAFPGSTKQLVRGETNWIWFLYYGEYENYTDRSPDSFMRRKPDYVFYYYPKHLTYDPERNLLMHNKGKKTWKTALIAEVSKDAKLLKVSYD